MYYCFYGTKNFLNFTCARAIIEHRLYTQNDGYDTIAYVVTSEDDYVFETQNLKDMKKYCFKDVVQYVLDRTRVTKIYDERTNRPGTVDMDAALVIKDRVNAMRGMGECKEIVAVDISNLEHEADLRGRGLEINELSETLDLVVEQIKRILTRNN